jgi:hypothetical protein
LIHCVMLLAATKHDFISENLIYGKDRNEQLIFIYIMC